MMTFLKQTVGQGLVWCGILVSSSLATEEVETVLTAEQLQAGAVVSASCGECQFGMEGASCDLAVRINGQAYFVDGTAIDDHGDAHAADGFCSAVRSARVAGSIVDGRFHTTSFELIGEGQSDGDQGKPGSDPSGSVDEAPGN